MRHSICNLLVLAAVSGASAASAECIQDQYGNQYSLTMDVAHKSISGIATISQQDGVQWTLSGSYVGQAFKGVQQITFADPNNTNELFMLKGNFPKFAWYYNGVYGGQDSIYTECSAPVAPSSAPLGGRLGVRR